MSKVVWNIPLWDMVKGVPDMVPVIEDGRLVDRLYHVVCKYEMNANWEQVDALRGAISVAGDVYPIAHTAEGFIVAVYWLSGVMGMYVLNICGMPMFEQKA